MTWIVEASEEFSSVVRKHRKNRQLLAELDKKIRRLEEDPESVGGHLSGALHGMKSTRLVRTHRLIFRISATEKKVVLLALDHRGHSYEE